MIERVLIAGADIELTEVLAALTIRHGRASVDDGPLASSASLTLVGVTRQRVAAFAVGEELELLLAFDVPRFRGRITDAELTEDGLQLVAVSSLARLAGRTIGEAGWPAETWRARLLRVFTEARILREWQEAGEDFADEARTWLNVGLAGRLDLDTLDDGPMIAARDPGATTVASYLGGGISQSEDGQLANMPDGAVLVQQLSVRSGRPEQNLDSALVAYAPRFDQTDELENELELTWTGGVVYADSPGSIGRFEAHPAKIDTELDVAGAAAAQANLRVTRRAYPRWVAAPIELLELDAALTIGDPVRLHDLPEWAPASGYLGILEGWEDRLEPDEAGGLSWRMRLFLSDPRLSGGFGILWPHTDAAWLEAPPATWNDPATLLS